MSPAPKKPADTPESDAEATPDAKPVKAAKAKADTKPAKAKAGAASAKAKASETVVEGAPAADVERTEATDVEVVATTDAVDTAPEVTEEPAATEPKAEGPGDKPDKPARKRDAKPAAPARKPNGKILRDKHGLPITTGPVVQAHAKYVRTSARKARLVCDHIRGKSVDEAVAILAHTPRAVAEDWEKLLKSAVANAEHNHELLGDDLKVHAVYADEGPTLKRFRPRAMGRATKIRKRTSHLTIQLTPKEQ